MQTLARGKLPAVHSVAPKGIRAIATHNVGAARGHTPLATYLNLFSRSQHAIKNTIPRLTKFFGTPPVPGQIGPRIYARMPETIQGRMSMSTRISLSRPLRASGMPRPSMVPQPFHEIGLGTARKFSSQSTFQHIINNNTSIATRAFWEAGWDLKAAEERRTASRPRYRSPNTPKKATHQRARRIQDDISLYFPEPVKPSVITYLQIALAPTPSTAMPLTLAEDAMYLLPLRTILDNHNNFQAHAQDVAAIFAALDSAHVWHNGASMESWGDTRGLCVELRIKFDGWTESRLRCLLGPLLNIPGCSLQEVRSSPVPSIVLMDEPELGLFGDFPSLDFVMPQLVVPLDALVDNFPPIPPSSPTLSLTSMSDPDSYLDLDGSLSDSESVHVPDTTDGWEASVSSTSAHHTSILSLSSSFLSRL